MIDLKEELMKIKIKKLDERAKVPTKANPGDAGYDLYATEVGINKDIGYFEVKTGLAFEIPKGHVGYIFPRSSISKKKLFLSNSVGVVDSGYRGEVTFRFKPTNVGSGLYEEGDRVGQLIVMPIPEIEFEVVKNLSETQRGSGGYGSSDGEKEEVTTRDTGATDKGTSTGESEA